jgi:predicted transcriptional regulator
MARVLISMKDEFLKLVDDVAASEQRTRSELIREALRSYIRQSGLALNSLTSQTNGAEAAAASSPSASGEMPPAATSPEPTELINSLLAVLAAEPPNASANGVSAVAMGDAVDMDLPPAALGVTLG